MKKLNLAIIGQGRSGYSIHGSYFKTDDAKEHFNVVAVVDYDEKRRARAAEEFGCDTYADYREMLQKQGRVLNQIKPVTVVNTPEREEFFLSHIEK